MTCKLQPLNQIKFNIAFSQTARIDFVSEAGQLCHGRGFKTLPTIVLGRNIPS